MKEFTHWHLEGLKMQTLSWIWQAWAEAQIARDGIDFPI